MLPKRPPPDLPFRVGRSHMAPFVILDQRSWSRIQRFCFRRKKQTPLDPRGFAARMTMGVHILLGGGIENQGEGGKPSPSRHRLRGAVEFGFEVLGLEGLR